MAVLAQRITDNYAAYNGDCCEVVPILPSESIGYSIYSPPFGADLYNFSSSDRDMSNARSYGQFLEHYSFLVSEIHRVTQPGRLTTVHCMDIAKGNDLVDFPGDIIRLHEQHGFVYHDRKAIWKEPLRVAMRTRALGLRHSQLVKDSSLCRSALADYVLTFRKKGTNREPIEHDLGLTNYAGEEEIPEELLRFKNWKDPKTNKLSHWIWRRYASSIWHDIRINEVLPYKGGRESEEEKHICPLQLDVIERCLTLYSNKGNTILTPFAGVGSEIYTTVKMERKAVAVELKPSYFRQLLQNMDMLANGGRAENQGLDMYGDEESDPEALIS